MTSKLSLFLVGYVFLVGCFFLVGYFLAASLPVVVADVPDAQLVDTAHRAADLSVLGPYVLTARVVLGAGSKKEEHAAHLTIYGDGTNCRSDLDMEGVKDFRVTLEQKRYLDPNRDLLAVTRLERIDRSWDPETPLVPTMLDRRRGAP